MPKDKVEKKGQLVYMHRVKPEPVSWLWPLRFPAGKLSILMGDPGLGKSTIAIDIAARISAAADWPDGGKAPGGNILILTAEDGLADTVRPRIDRQDGNPKCIAVLDSVKVGDDEREFNLVVDIDALEQAIDYIRPQVVIIDPLSAYLGGKDENKNAEIRGLLLPLTKLAEKYKVAIICVLHMNKGQGKAIYRASGSIAFGAAPRAVFCVAKDPANKDRRLFFPVKTNLSKEPPGLAYSFTPEGKLVWEDDPIDVNPEDVLGNNGGDDSDKEDKRDAEEFMDAILPPGHTISVNDLYRDARENGFTIWQIKYACRELGIKSHQVDRKWYRTRSETQGASQGVQPHTVLPDVNPNGKPPYRQNLAQGAQCVGVLPDLLPESRFLDKRLMKELAKKSEDALASRDEVTFEEIPATALSPDSKPKLYMRTKKGKKR